MMRKLFKGRKSKGGEHEKHDTRDGKLHKAPDPSDKIYVQDSDARNLHPRPDDSKSKDTAESNDVGTFSGFDSWLSSFAPDPTKTAVEMDGESASSETLTIEGYPQADYLSLIIDGVRRPGHAQKYVVRLNGPWYMTLAAVNTVMEKHGYEGLGAAKNTLLARPDWKGTKAYAENYEVLVTDGPSCYDPDRGLLINRDETLDTFSGNMRRLRVECTDGGIVASSFPAKLRITFRRTLRLPDNGKIHNLPSDLGLISAHNIEGIKKRLTASGSQSLVEMAKKGGVFFPLYQREAMFMSFEAEHGGFALRVFVGGVNAVSGLPWNAGPHRKAAQQDYLSVPPQQYLDGISAGRASVKQFVAMPLGSGYSVEKQITGKEDVGGLQLEVIPDDGWYLAPAPEVPYSPHLGIQTPRTLGIETVLLLGNHMIREDTDLSAPEYAGFTSSLEHSTHMRRYFFTQLQQGLYSPYPGLQSQRDTSDPASWKPGACLRMTAVYVYNLTLTWSSGAGTMSREVRWLPWATVSDCAIVMERLNFRINGKLLDQFDLYCQGRILGSLQLQEMGIQDNSIIVAVEKVSGPPQPQFQDQYGPPRQQYADEYMPSEHGPWQPTPGHANPIIPGSTSSGSPTPSSIQPNQQGHGYAPPLYETFTPSPPGAAAPPGTAVRPPGSSLPPGGPPRTYGSPGPGPGAPRPHSSTTIGSPLPGYTSPSPGMAGAGSPPSLAPPKTGAPPATHRGSSAPQADQTGWAMGVAAGSQIRQVVRKDPFAPSEWAKHRAATLSVQILNSVAFEGLTGMLAPPTPISAETYAAHGLPFHASYGEAEAAFETDGATNFAGVRSVAQIDASHGPVVLGSNITAGSKVGCTCCGKMLCDSILRPCNHAFCSQCIRNWMAWGNKTICRVCGQTATGLVGFSAPMALPGQDVVDFSEAVVVTNEPYKGELGFASVYELEARSQPQPQQQPIVYELGA